ncbi:MAG: hypothetical protein EDM05_002475 [Leptolyngbya sp. IPPAS B-1204]
MRHYILQNAQTEEVKAIPLNLTVTDQPLAQSLASDDAELKARIDRYKNHLLQMVRWSSATRKRLIVGIQPELSSRSPEQMPASEKAILEQLGENYSQKLQLAIRSWSAPLSRPPNPQPMPKCWICASSTPTLRTPPSKPPLVSPMKPTKL